MQNDLESLLNEAKELLKEEVTSISFSTWISPIKIDSMEDNHIVLSVNDSFKIDTIKNRYGSLITNTFNYLLHKDCTVSFVLESEEKPTQIMQNTTNISILQPVLNTTIDKKYTFDNYIVGENNRLAHAAALAVAEAPGTAYNPLFIYGGPGLGKTHLMHAIGNEALKLNNKLKVVYISSENFTNDFVDSIKNNNIDKFREKYRNIDILLIDDIQFIAGKERIQEEFFHTFEDLRNNGKQIIISSDKPPRDIDNLEERLKNRFAWGVMADISMADYETRLAILRKKQNDNHVIISDDILSNIATKIDSTIRELEGVFNKLIITSNLTHAQITLEMSEKAINDVIRQSSDILTAESIQQTVCNFFNISIEDMKSANRSNNIAFPRQIAMYLCRTMLHMSFKDIANSFNKKDHTTIIYACSKLEEEIKSNSQTQQIVDSVKKIINNKNNS